MKWKWICTRGQDVDVVNCLHQYLKKVKEEVELPASCPLGIINRTDGRPHCTVSFCGSKKMKVRDYKHYCDLDKMLCGVVGGTEEAEERYKKDLGKLATVDWDKEGKGKIRL